MSYFNNKKLEIHSHKHTNTQTEIDILDPVLTILALEKKFSLTVCPPCFLSHQNPNWNGWHMAKNALASHIISGRLGCGYLVSNFNCMYYISKLYFFTLKIWLEMAEISNHKVLKCLCVCVFLIKNPDFPESLFKQSEKPWERSERAPRRG